MSDNLREQVDDAVPDDVELFEEDGDIHGRDSHGEFKIKPMAGAAEPQENRCGWTLKYTQERYGQMRYCTGLPEKRFVDGGSERCKHHKVADSLMEHWDDLYKHGYFATNYANFVSRLEAEKFLFAVEMVDGLFEKSKHDFDITYEKKVIDTSESDYIPEDEMAIELPMPTNDMALFHANELWTASLKQVMTQNMHEVVFKDGMEKETLADSADADGQITDTIHEKTEHHLHLPISRLAKDIKEHLKNGGVAIDDDESGVLTFQKNDYTLDVQPTETDSADAQDVSEVGSNFTEELEAAKEAELDE